MASSPTRPHRLHPQQKQQLYPIRVDVTSSDRQLRLVDTLLWDPSIVAVEEDPSPDQLALDLVRDAVVLGMGRAARHFTNRLEISETVELQEKVSRQLADQFRAMREIEALPGASAPAAAITPAVDSNNDKKRKREDEQIPSVDSSSELAMEKDASSGVSVKEEGNASKPKSEGDATKNAKDTTLPTPAPSKNLIPIHLRLSAHGVRVHDEFDYDPQVLSPLQVAQSIATDLKLSQEMVVSVAIDIAEQVAAAGGPPLVLPDQCQVVEEDEGGPQERRNLTAAWMLQNRVHVTNVAHLVAQHRPMEPKK